MPQLAFYTAGFAIYIRSARTTTTGATNMALEYRAARPNDVPECLVLRGKTRENSISPEGLNARGITIDSWVQDIRQGVLAGYVCISDSRIVGYCFGARESGEVAVLALLPAFENRGIGKSLLNRVIRELRTSGFNRLFLGCSPDPSTRSYGFYRHLGWHSTGTFDAAGDEVLELFLERPGQQAPTTQGA
ncbi:MAG: GNAT family N-acetyltransferase [Rhodoferax sp.]